MPELGEHVASVRKILADLYEGQTRSVPFHGLHHVHFVADKARDFAYELGADAATAEIAALVHDVNYLIDARGDAAVGSHLRSTILKDAGLDNASIAVIEDTVISAETRVRDDSISREAMALSDADTLFKALPITPVVLAPLYMRETGRSVRELAEKIIHEQVPLRDSGIYFYSDSAKKRYEGWGDVNLALWSCILEALDDPTVVNLIDEVGQYTKIPQEMQV
ncbi:MAG TPA: hypothetical protein VGH27_18485 [Streptosporangiaceae bacterium]|jgi:uncharacterized protein